MERFLMVNTIRNQKKSVFVILLALLFCFSLQATRPVHAETEPTQLANVILVKFQAGTSEMERSKLIGEMGGQLLRWIDAISTAQIQLPDNWATARSGMDALSVAKQNPIVNNVEFDSIVGGVPIVEEKIDSQPRTVNSTIPTTPVQVNDADYLNPQMQVYAPDIINLRMAWNYTMASAAIKIAILDSGILASHPEFAGRILPGYDFVNNDADPNDDYGHGTHVAGIAAAGANNGIGMLGVCPLCSIIPVKVLDSSNQGTWGGVANGIVFAVDAGANVINLSLGGASVTQAVTDAILYAAAHNVVVVAAAGNGRSNTPFYPAAMDEVIGVAATRNDDTRWSLSNYGSFVELSAPGYAIYSTYNDMNNTYHGYTYMSGTSMAAPHVAGLAGLLFSQNPSITVAQVRALMQSTAADLGDPGRDDYFGYGRIDAFAALQAGAPVLQSDASVSGLVWQDDNSNGIWEENEATFTDGVSIQLYDDGNSLVGETTSNGTGQWAIANLYPGGYRVAASTSGNTRLTTLNTYNVQLESGREIAGLNFGIAQTEPIVFSHQLFIPTIEKTQ